MKILKVLFSLFFIICSYVLIVKTGLVQASCGSSPPPAVTSSTGSIHWRQEETSPLSCNYPHSSFPDNEYTLFSAVANNTGGIYSGWQIEVTVKASDNSFTRDYFFRTSSPNNNSLIHTNGYDITIDYPTNRDFSIEIYVSSPCDGNCSYPVGQHGLFYKSSSYSSGVVSHYDFGLQSSPQFISGPYNC